MTLERTLVAVVIGEVEAGAATPLERAAPARVRSARVVARTIRLRDRRSAKPAAPKPASIIIQVPGSGTAWVWAFTVAKPTLAPVRFGAPKMEVNAPAASAVSGRDVFGPMVKKADRAHVRTVGGYVSGDEERGGVDHEVANAERTAAGREQDAGAFVVE